MFNVSNTELYAYGQVENINLKFVYTNSKIAPIEEHTQGKGHDFDIRKDPFAYCYFYGLFVHKLGHFHDIVVSNAAEILY